VRGTETIIGNVARIHILKFKREKVQSPFLRATIVRTQN